MTFLDIFNIGINGVLRNALVGTILLSISSSIVGTFTLLRKQSLIADVISHSVLPGICVGFIVHNERNLLIILLFAALTGWISTLFVEWIKRHPKITSDTASAITLSSFFGIGVMLLLYIINSPSLEIKSGISSFLYGSVIGISNTDIHIFAIIVVALIVIVYVFYRGLIVFTFDERFAQSIGIPVSFLKIVLSIITVIAIVIGIQAVGVILIAALLITPAVIARFWTHRISHLIFIACGAGVLGAVIGVERSYQMEVPTGPWIVFTLSCLALLSFLFSTKSGLIPKYICRYQSRKRMTQEDLLKALYHHKKRTDSYQFNTETASSFKSKLGHSKTLSVLKALQKQRYISLSEKTWTLSEHGYQKGKRLVKLHRLWEVYLTKHLNIKVDHVHEDADSIEHIITPEIEKQLEEYLGKPETDPHNQKIPYRNDES